MVPGSHRWFASISFSGRPFELFSAVVGPGRRSPTDARATGEANQDRLVAPRASLSWSSLYETVELCEIREVMWATTKISSTKLRE